MYFKISSAICLNLDQSKVLLSGNGLNLKLSSANSFSLEESKICCLGKSHHHLTFFHTIMIFNNSVSETI